MTQPSTNELSPFQRALECEKLDVAEMILSHGANIHKIWEQILDGYFSLVLSDTLSDVDLQALVLCLRAKGCLPNKDSRIQTLFRQMATRLRLSVAQMIYDNGYQPPPEDLKIIGGVLDKEEWLVTEGEEVDEEKIRWFKLWLFEAVNYPRSLKNWCMIAVRKSFTNNTFHGAQKLNLGNLIL